MLCWVAGSLTGAREFLGICCVSHVNSVSETRSLRALPHATLLLCVKYACDRGGHRVLAFCCCSPSVRRSDRVRLMRLLPGARSSRRVHSHRNPARRERTRNSTISSYTFCSATVVTYARSGYVCVCVQGYVCTHTYTRLQFNPNNLR